MRNRTDDINRRICGLRQEYEQALTGDSCPAVNEQIREMLGILNTGGDLDAIDEWSTRLFDLACAVAGEWYELNGQEGLNSGIGNSANIARLTNLIRDEIRSREPKNVNIGFSVPSDTDVTSEWGQRAKAAIIAALTERRANNLANNGGFLDSGEARIIDILLTES